jgi:hypothetical protein
MTKHKNSKPFTAKGRRAKLADPNDYGKEAMRRLRKQFGGNFGAANKGRALSSSEIEEWKRENGFLD